MPVITRRRNLEANDDCRRIYFGDVRVGTIAIRTGNPHDTDPWEWWCGFYPVSHPREHQSGTATFDQARADFEAASACPCRTGRKPIFRRGVMSETRRKYALWDAGNRLPANEWEPGKPCKIYLKCPCGEIFNTQRLEETVIHVPHITAAATLH